MGAAANVQKGEMKASINNVPHLSCPSHPFTEIQASEFRGFFGYKVHNSLQYSGEICFQLSALQQDAADISC